jgi:hypothetical protein
MKKIVILGIIVIFFSGCQFFLPETAVNGDGSIARTASISDSVHKEGNERFYWLPPVAAGTALTGVFDPSLNPVVEICEWTGNACVLPAVGQFTMISGTGGETVKLSLADEYYLVNWHTKYFALDDQKTYRIRVLLSGTEIGHADVDVVNTGRDLKKVDTNKYIPLKNGRTLPIKFRIEEGAVSENVWGTFAWGAAVWGP